VFIGKIESRGETRGGVARIHRAVSVPKLGSLACGTPFWIAFADNDRNLFQFRECGDRRKPIIDVLQLVRHAHSHVSVLKNRTAFGVERHEVQGRALLTRGVVGSVQAMFQEIVKEMSSRPSGGIRTSYASVRQRAANARSRAVVQFELFFRARFPIKDVRLVPNFPAPLVNRLLAVASQ
jgi:hypothetical protein